MSSVLELLERHANEQRQVAVLQEHATKSLRITLEEVAAPLAEMAAAEAALAAELEDLRRRMVTARQRYDQIEAEANAREAEADTATEAAEALDELAERHRKAIAPRPAADAITEALVASGGPTVDTTGKPPIPRGETSAGVRDLAQTYADQTAQEAALTNGRPWTPDREEIRDGRKVTVVTVKRSCNGCRRELGDATEEELTAPASGAPLPNVRHECPECSAVPA